MRAALLALLFALLAGPVLADDVTDLPGLTRQSMMLPDAPSGSLEALAIRPDGPGPFPLALITHGMPRDAIAIAASRPQGYTGPAIGFVQRGYAAVIVMRRGYGHSTGPFAEDLGPCGNRDYVKSGEAAADDVIAALAALRHQTWVDPSRIVLVGHSMGGFAVLAASGRNPTGVRGIISFAGAVGSPRPDFVCQPDRLVAADRQFGATAQAPALWIFAANDHFFAPDLARTMFTAYAAGRANAALFAAPAFGHDGHLLIFTADPALWWPEVDAFLATLALPARVQIDLPPITPLPPPGGLDAAGNDAFGAYVPSRSYERAFAVGADGHYGVAYGQRTKADAAQAALKDCQRDGHACSVYAVGNVLQPQAMAP